MKAVIWHAIGDSRLDDAPGRTSTTRTTRSCASPPPASAKPGRPTGRHGLLRWPAGRPAASVVYKRSTPGYRARTPASYRYSTQWMYPPHRASLVDAGASDWTPLITRWSAIEDAVEAYASFDRRDSGCTKVAVGLGGDGRPGSGEYAGIGAAHQAGAGGPGSRRTSTPGAPGVPAPGPVRRRRAGARGEGHGTRQTGEARAAQHEPRPA